MSKKLNRIRELIAEAQTSLEQLKPKSLTKAELDKVTRDRAMLRDKLELLHEQEELELALIHEEEAANKAERRKALLIGLAESARDHKKAHDHLNTQIGDALGSLFKLLKERDQVVSNFSFGDRLVEARELLEKEELTLVGDCFRDTRWARQSEAPFISDFSGCWYQQLRAELEPSSPLYKNLSRFASKTQEPKSLETIGDQLIELSEQLLEPPVEAEEAELEEESNE
ncbi:hypothetical protein ACNO5E_17655 [Vibrio parahaemolyticus]